MQPTRTGLFFSWMREPELEKLVSAFSGSDIYYVGGCVRNSLAGLPVRDIDLATPLPPEQVALRLEQASIPFKEIGKAFGTLIAIINGSSFEITSFRKDIETDGRHAKVVYTDQLSEDAARRDFTFNALYLTPNGELYDLWGGEADLHAGHVNFIGHAMERIREDYLRILRFFRFYAFFGQQNPDPSALHACRYGAPLLNQISAERFHDELLKLLSAPRPLKALKCMHKAYIMDRFLDIYFNMAAYEKLTELEEFFHKTTPPLLRLWVLFGKDLFTLAARFAFSKREKAILQEYSRHPTISDKPIQRWLYVYGIEITQAFIFLDGLNGVSQDELVQKWEIVEKWQHPMFPLKGTDATRLGLSGIRIKYVLNAIEEWWIEQDFKPTREQCLCKLLEII